jgi:multidrug resistance efflux pump
MSYRSLRGFQDGRDFFSTRVSWLLPGFVFIITAVFGGIFAFCWFGEIDEIVSVRAVLRPDMNISIVKNAIAGPVVEKLFLEGQKVRKGELLWKINTRSFEVERDNMLREYSMWQAQMKTLSFCLKAMDLGDEAIPDSESEAITRTEIYLAELKKRELASLKAFDAWQREIDMPATMTSAIRIKDLETEKELAQLQYVSFPSQTRLQLQEEQKTINQRMQDIQNSLASIQRRIEDSMVMAPLEGIVEPIKKINQGDYLLSGEEILRIVPSEVGRLKAELIVENRDIARIEVGMPVTLRFTALSPSEFGQLEGRITKVPADVERISSSEEQNVFILEATLDTTYLESKRTGKVYLRVGMTAEGRIRLQHKSIFRFLIERLSFIE